MISINKVKLIGVISIFIFGINNIVYATEIKVTGEEGKQNLLIPSPYSVTMPEEVLNNDNVSETGLENEASYDLRSKYNVEVKNQGSTLACWTDSLLSSVELNLNIKQNINVNLSEKYLNYATSTSFNDGENKMAFNRVARDGGSTLVGLASLTNGQGAILEEKMPFTYNLDDISLESINVNPDFYVKGYNALPVIYKTNKNGKIVYSDGYGKEYTIEDVQKIRKIIKKHIVENGAITSYTSANAKQYYDGETIFSSTAYFCNDASIPVDHAVTIIGWDDNYSKENFKGAVKPSNDGAYLVLNSYSKNNFENGCMYVSYEDVWIETMLYGVNEVSEIDYDNLYQHNELGADIPMTMISNNNKVNEGYYANIYKRNTNSLEILNQISVPTNQYAKFEIYVNPNGTDLNINNLRKVATTGFLEPGYNTIKFNNVILSGKEFAVVVKQTALEGPYYCMLEAKVDGTFWENASSSNGNSKISVDGIEWKDLSELGSFYYEGCSVNLANADVCIKAFTMVPFKNNVMKMTSVSYTNKMNYSNNLLFGLLNAINLHNFIDIIAKMV